MRKIAIAIVILVVFLIWDYHRFLSSVLNIEKNILVVEQGMGFNDLEAAITNKNEGIFASLYYPLYVRIKAPALRSGPHIIPANTSFESAITILSRDPDNIRVRLPEGDRMELFAEILSKSGLGAKNDLLACFKGCAQVGGALFDEKSGYEGFLFPDTYVFGPNTSPAEIVELLLKNFRNKIEPLITKYSGFLENHSVRNVVILASLLEREAVSLEDKRIVAGILYNRLKEGMRLDVDATVSYIKGDWRAPITYSDLQSNSAYNTRKSGGLPPGPICNPGLISLEAAMSPTPSQYFYYLTGSNGQMYYARTLEEHNWNKSKFL